MMSIQEAYDTMNIKRKEDSSSLASKYLPKTAEESETWQVPTLN
jgi:hypothetical protein